MAFQFTFTNRFKKHYNTLSSGEKKQLKNKLALLAENPMHPSLRRRRGKSCVNSIKTNLLGENYGRNNFYQGGFST